MRPSITCLSLLFLMSCKSGFPTIQPQEKCYTVLESKKTETIEEKEVVLYEGHCRCFLYEGSSSHIGRISTPGNYELSKCDKMGGFAPDEDGNLYIWHESIRLWLNRISKRK